MELSQLFLRSLKVIKDSSKRHESSHCNKMEVLATKKINLETPDGRRLKGTRKRGELGFHNSGVEPLLSSDQ